MRIFLRVNAVVVLIVICTSVCLYAKDPAYDHNSNNLKFSKEATDVLERKKEIVIAGIVQNKKIIERVIECNIKNENLTESDIQKMDEQWRSSTGISDFERKILMNETSQYLMDFQDQHRGYAEMFITDKKGLIVSMTNKTSDFYQADESWWIIAYNEGKGKAHFGDIEYDESAYSEAIPLTIPIKDPITQEMIGIIKVVIDITSVKLEL